MIVRKVLRYLSKAVNYTEMTSAIGKLTLITSAAGLHAILWDNDCEHVENKRILQTLHKSSNDEITRQTKKQLTEYFQGQRKFFDVPLILNGTDFQIKAWKELLKIPYAMTASYAEQAEKMGNRNKCRAVGMANGLNPISIIIPCHRVIGSKGDLVGFAGGIDKKAYLLNLERQYADQ